MKRMILAAATALALAGSASAEPDPKALVYTLPDKIAWKQDRLDGPQTYVLWGDPDRPGPYAMLVRWPPHHMSRPHTHPYDRHIVVLSGTWWVGTGKDYSPDTTTPLPAGTVVTHLANQFHYDGAKDEPAVLEIVGEGPQYATPEP
jgi:quercetin dioxygenase-like cupin family protein